jgi:YVTN family beta-propeller protein
MPTGRASGRGTAAGVVVSAVALVLLVVAVASAAFGSVGFPAAARSTGAPAESSLRAALAAGSDPLRAPPQLVATVDVGKEPVSAAYDGANGYVYVANVFSDNLTVFNGTSVVAWINLPDDLVEGPHFVTYDPLNHLVYVLDEEDFVTGEGAVTVLSGLSVATTLSVGPFPTDAVLDPATGNLYVTAFGSDVVSVINASGNATIANVTVGSGPIAAAYDPADGSVYVANALSDNVSVL